MKGPNGEPAPGEPQAARPTPPAKVEARLIAPKETTIAARAPAQVEARDGAAANAGWMIQIGATDDPGKANALLIRARAQNRSTLASAKPVTEKIGKGTGAYLPRALRRALISLRPRIRLPLPQTQWIFLLSRPTTDAQPSAELSDPCHRVEPRSGVAASERPWPD